MQKLPDQKSIANRVWRELLTQLQRGDPIAVSLVEDLKVCVCSDGQQFLWMIAFEDEPPLAAGSAADAQTACVDAARMTFSVSSRYPMLGDRAA